MKFKKKNQSVYLTLYNRITFFNWNFDHVSDSTIVTALMFLSEIIKEYEPRNIQTLTASNSHLSKNCWISWLPADRKEVGKINLLK